MRQNSAGSVRPAQATPRVLLVLLVVISSFRPVVGALAQNLASSSDVEPARAVVSPRDSTRLLAGARAAQAAFERLRQSRLPFTLYSGGGTCDERVGRFCLTHGSGRSTWTARPEHERVIDGRADLITHLQQAAALLPGDRWIAGQLVRYLVESRRSDEAVDAARACRASGGWCSALEGFAHHYAGRPGDAHASFDRALDELDEARRRVWLDLAPILDARSARVYRRLSEPEKEAFGERFWRLADPLPMYPGNELRSEHLARHVWNELQDRARAPDGLAWGDDLRELLIRYGWPAGWEQIRSSGIALGQPSLLTRYTSAPQYMLPPSATLLDETGTAGLWDVEEPRPRTSYNIPLTDSVARWVTPMDHQIAVFRRADSAFVVAAYDFPADSLIRELSVVEAGFSLMSTTDPIGDPIFTIDPRAPLAGSLGLVSAARPMLMTLAVVVPEERWIGRARYGLDIRPVPAQLLAISDLLLLRDTAELPDSLAAAMPLARGHTRVGAGEDIGVFWELYGISPETTPTVGISLRLVEVSTGLIRRLAEGVGISREVAPIRLRWEEPILTEPFVARSLTIRIPDVRPGRYAIELSVEAPGREALNVRREIEIIRSPR